MTCYLYLISDNDGSQQDARLPSIIIKYADDFRDRTGGLQLHSRSSSTIPATMNKKNSVLRISFRWKGDDSSDHEDKDSRIVIKVVKESEVLFEIKDWAHPSSNNWSKIDRCYNYSHDYIKNLEEGCHFELHYAVGGDVKYENLSIKDFELCVEGKLIVDIENLQLYLSMINLYDISADGDASQRDDTLPLISIQSQSWEHQTEGLQFHTRSSSTIPATINKQNSVLRIAFRWIGHEDSRIVIKVVKKSEVLFEIEDWTYNPSHTSIKRYYNSISSKIDRYYNYSHDYIKNLEEGCHFELYYAVGGGVKYENLRIKDFELCVEGKLIVDIA